MMSYSSDSQPAVRGQPVSREDIGTGPQIIGKQQFVIKRLFHSSKPEHISI